MMVESNDKPDDVVSGRFGGSDQASMESMKGRLKRGRKNKRVYEMK
jgi:hypothetical protein